MQKQKLSFTTWKKNILKNPEIKKEYEVLQPEMAVVKAVIEARAKNGVTQKDLAQKIGTKQSVISRFESGRSNPSLTFLKNLAEALNSDLEIKFIPR